MNVKLKFVFASFFRVALTRLTTALMMFYVAVFFDSADLAIAALLILYLNLNELLLENGTFESYVRNYSVPRRLGFSSVKYVVFFVSVLSTIVFSIAFNDIFYLFLSVIVFLMGFNINFISYLKYRQKLPMITKAFVKANLVMLVFFFSMQLYIDDFKLIPISLFIQQIVIFVVFKRYQELLKIQSSAVFFRRISLFSMYLKELAIPVAFKFSAFFSSKIIEIFLVVMFGVSVLSNYVAGSRIYNIFLLFLFAIINEVFLKNYKKHISADLDSRLVKDIYFLGIFICPIFVLCYLNADFIINFLFSDKYEQASLVLKVFSVFGFFQILYVLIHQVSLLKINVGHSVKFNILSVLSVFLSFAISFLLNISFTDFLVVFVLIQVFSNIGFVLWFLTCFELRTVNKHLLLVLCINIMYCLFGFSIKFDNSLVSAVIVSFAIYVASIVVFYFINKLIFIKLGVNDEGK